MAMSVPTEGSSDDTPMSDINTTPLVDVMLVLLIIFLITVPVVIQTVPLSLPNVNSVATTTKPENINLSVRGGAGGCETFWGTTAVDTTAALRERGATALRAEVDRQTRELGGVRELPEVHIRGDRDTPYRCVGGVIFAMQQAGYQRIGFISEPAAGSVTRN